jgi:xanthosine phosphorylase
VSATQAAAVLRAHGRSPRVGIVLGSGLGAVADAVADANAIPYAELPGFPRPTVQGHAGQAVLGDLGGVPVAVLQGRQHLYEAPPPETISTPVRALRAAGAEILVLTNAAGSLRPDVGPGSLMAITDHINLTGSNPLTGPNDDAIGPRFPSLHDAYDHELRGTLHATADQLGTPLADGVYLAVSGPSFETPAEIRAFRTLGADAVGMSTVHETILARHAGLRVAAVSAISNLAEGLSDVPLSHEQTLTDAERAAGDLARLLEASSDGWHELPGPGGHPPQARRRRSSAEEIEWLVAGITDGSVSDAQVGALAMAIVINGMDARRARRADRGDDALGRGPRTGTSTARCSTSTRPAGSATRSRCCSAR